jgi:hypothetical protein
MRRKTCAVIDGTRSLEQLFISALGAIEALLDAQAMNAQAMDAQAMDAQAMDAQAILYAKRIQTFRSRSTPRA